MKIFLTLFFLCAVVFASEITLKDKLAEATVGNYLVTEQNKTYTFLHVYERRGEKIALEEVTISAETFRALKMPWRLWFESGAPGNTAWTLSQINLRSGCVEEIYSFTHGGWVDLNKSDTFFPTLLNLRFQETGPSERRHVGLPPGYGKPDHRPLWHPKLIVGGAVIGHVPFSAWKARWPADGSELSRKIIEVYLPEAVSGASYPTYFPYWLEVEGKIGSAKIRVVDSGLDAKSPRAKFPHRKPVLLNQGKWNGEVFSFDLKNPSHFSEFMVMAEEADSLFGKSFPLPCEVECNGDVTTLFLKKSDMEKVMTQEQGYRFLISSQEEPDHLLEMKHTFIFR